MKNKMGLLVSTLALSISAGVSADTDKPWNYMLGEQNPYPTPTTNEHLISPDGYDFVSMSLFTRHGSRYALDYNLVPSRLAEIKEVAKKAR
ncbi:hypothetical protein C9I98_08150 [Photobacterium sanctipauli]|uniref:Histidine-type phosphatase n=2 Tax=Photobacterium sanctipauli TaxID=1342794 RepID=A0A2T3NWZ2_9GAMM|nr:hypothetical protein [Photobacterium sanctipauli]PSW20800.1 hypothetical protein C9I98_08150 [Photobacterium sanctipauli]